MTPPYPKEYMEPEIINDIIQSILLIFMSIGKLKKKKV